jgi:hypothetical protein
MNGWHRGPPPSIGWWPTQEGESAFARGVRWWDGTRWSFAPRESDPPGIVQWCAEQRSHMSPTLFWSERPAEWPSRGHT